LLQSGCKNSGSSHQSQCDLRISPAGGCTAEGMLRLMLCWGFFFGLFIC